MFVKTFLAVTLFQILYVGCLADKLSLPISKDFNDAKPLPEEDQSVVTITGLCSEEENKEIRIEINIPDDLDKQKKNINIFFANENQEILKVELGEKVSGTKYITPYKLSKTFEKDIIEKKTATFPKSWLPDNTTRMSAALEFEDKIYCTYGLKNNAISIPDLRRSSKEFKSVQLRAEFIAYLPDLQHT